MRTSILSLACGLIGCGGLQLNVIDYSVRPPGNVAVYFTVDKSSGEPVPGLTADDFVIYEDGQPVSKHESGQTILNHEVAAAHYTLLLLDMSGSVTEAGQTYQLQHAAQTFTTAVEKYQRVAVFAFDGSPKLYPIVSFTPSGTRASDAIKRLANFSPPDPSTNLNGAVVKAVEQLQGALDQAKQPLKFGTLVIFTDGTDRAARVSRDDVMKVLGDTDLDVFTIGVGAEINESELRALGRTGSVIEADPDNVQQAFAQAARSIEGYTKRYYLLSYCSPARAGRHQLGIEAVGPDGAKGRLINEFDANHFGASCDPNRKPNFDTSLRRRRRGKQVGQPERSRNDEGDPLIENRQHPAAGAAPRRTG